MQDIMIDIETLGTEPGCVILSIAATNGRTEGFHIHLDVEDCVNNGLVIEPRTTMWWMEQGDAARKLITQPGAPLLSALTLFSHAFNWKEARVWCNGASFDFPILKAAFKRCQMALPWPYYAEMDFRTLKNLVSKETFETLRVKPVVAHDALADAVSQHMTLTNLINHLETQHVELKRAA